MGRKYKQTGYQDSGQERSRERSPQPPKRRGEGPRSPRMPGFQELMRCSMCGNIIPASLVIQVDSQCPKCDADLRSCKHCRHFDTGARFECTEAIPQRIMAKDKRNECPLFEPRKSIERETKSGSIENVRNPGAPKDARQAFDDLFR